MSNDGDIAVSPADLVSHAGHVDAVAATMATARRAGEATRPSTDAYGRLCVAVPMLLGELQGMIVDGVDAAARSLADTADRLRRTADDYAAADRRGAEGVRRAGSPR